MTGSVFTSITVVGASRMMGEVKEGAGGGAGGSHCIPQAREVNGGKNGVVICVEAGPDWDFR